MRRLESRAVVGVQPGESLPPLPAVATRLLLELENEKAALIEISRLIQMDAAFTAELLRLANSAVFAPRVEVTSVLHALSVLGLARVRALILTMALRDYLASVHMEELLHRCWRHNLATALASEWLAPRFWVEQSAAYTSGLMHDLGRLKLVAADAGRYGRLIRECERSGRALGEAEAEAFGEASEELKALLAREWRLPAPMVAGCCCQSGSGKASADAVGKLVELGCEMAAHMGFSLTGKPSPQTLEEIEASLPAWAKPAVAGKLEQLSDAVMMRLNLFECEFMAGCA